MGLKDAFVCEVCREVIRNPWDRLEKRIEFRRISDQGRYRTNIIGRYCITCAEDELGSKSTGPHLGQPLFLVGDRGEEQKA